jgi:hypothetical protein
MWLKVRAYSCPVANHVTGDCQCKAQPNISRNTAQPKIASYTQSQAEIPNYSLLFPAAFALAHLALAAAEIAALPAALIFRLAFLAGLADGAVPLILAHLAF